MLAAVLRNGACNQVISHSSERPEGGVRFALSVPGRRREWLVREAAAIALTLYQHLRAQTLNADVIISAITCSKVIAPTIRPRIDPRFVQTFARDAVVAEFTSLS